MPAFHPYPATDDDKDGIKVFVVELQLAAQEYFTSVENIMSVDTDPSPDDEELCIQLYNVFCNKLQVMKFIPPNVFWSTRTGHQSKRIPNLLKKVWFLTEQGELAPRDECITWKEPVLKIMDTLVTDITSAEIRYPASRQLLRKVMSPTSFMFWMTIGLFVLCLVALVGVNFAVAFGTIPDELLVALNCAVGVTGLLLGLLIVFSFMSCAFALEDWYMVSSQADDSIGGTVRAANGTNNKNMNVNAMSIPGVNSVNSRSDSNNLPSGSGPGVDEAIEREQRKAAAAGGNEVQTNPLTPQHRAPPSNSTSNGVIQSLPPLEPQPAPAQQDHVQNVGIAPAPPAGGSMSTDPMSAIASSSKTDKMGSATEMVELMRDLRDRRIRENHLIIQLEGSTAVLEAKSVFQCLMMVGFDDKFNINFWNEAAEDETGLVASNCIKRSIDDLLYIGYSGSPKLRKALQKRIANKSYEPLEITFIALATGIFQLSCIVVPMKDFSRRQQGHVLLCRHLRDELREMRNYIHRFRTTSIKAFVVNQQQPVINKAIKEGTFTSFLSSFEPSNLQVQAQVMAKKWEWISPSQFLSRALAKHLAKCRTSVNAKVPDMRLDLSAIDILENTVEIAKSKCMVSVTLSTEDHIQCLEIDVSADKKAKVPMTFDPEQTTFLANRVIAIGGWGYSSDKSFTMRLPCQTSEFELIDEPADDRNMMSGGNEEEMMMESVSAPVARFTSTISVATVVNDAVDKHNLSLVLLRLPFLSVASVPNLQVLKSSLTADIIVVEEALFLKTKQMYATANPKPYLVMLGNSGKFESDHFISTPIKRMEVETLMQNLGTEVDKRHKETREAAARDEILKSRQDSSWTQGKLLGRGAFGAVYEAVADLTGGKMAVKMFYFKAEDANIQAALLNEIQIMCQLQHPHIVHYFYCEHNVEDRSVNLFMELCDCSLHDKLQKQQKRVNTALIVKQTLEALAYLHQQGIAHRDIKPQNILVKGEVIKLTDFGTAVKKADADDVQGTIRFMAPEVYKGEKHDVSCDIWSVGCLVCDLEGCPPEFMHPRKADLLADLTSVEVPGALQKYPDEYDFVCQCLQLDPELRPSAEMLLLHPYLSKGGDLFLPDRRYSSVPHASMRQNRSTANESLFSFDSDSDDAAPAQEDNVAETLFTLM